MIRARRLEHRMNRSFIWMTAAMGWLHRRMERRRSRRVFAALNDAQLKDIGLSRGEASREIIRPFSD